MKKINILIYCIVLLLVTVFSSQAQQIGCCCDPDGNALKGSFQAAEECNDPFAFSPVDDPSFLIGRSLQEPTICDDWCGEASPPEVVGVTKGCGNVDYVPAPSDFRVVPVKGEPKFQLSWSNNCTDFINYLVLERCEGAGCNNFDFVSRISLKTYFVDPDELFWDTNYTYRLKTVFQHGESAWVSETGNTGDIECEGVDTSNPICLSHFYYEKFQDYFTNNGYKFKSADQFSTDFNKTVTDIFQLRFNKGYRCDMNNRITKIVDCPEDQVCMVSAGTAVCSDAAACQQLAPSHFGLNYTVDNCEGSGEDQNFCFLDKSKTLGDMCYNCHMGMSCIDYHSQGACERNNCGAGDCEWRDLYPEIGIGVCVDKTMDNCELCNLRGSSVAPNLQGFNDIFDICTSEKASLLVTDPSKPCFFTQGEAKGCDKIACPDYSTESMCGSPVGGIMLSTENNITNPSTDPCGIGVCQWSSLFGCGKNADGRDNLIEGDFRDCAKYELESQKKACEHDYFPPETEMIPIGEKIGRVDYLEIQRLEKTLKHEEPVEVPGKEAPTYFCIYTPGEPVCNDFSLRSTNSRLIIDNIFLQDVRENPTTGKREPTIISFLTEGKNIIRYFSIDQNENIETVKEITFGACSACMGPKVLNITIDGRGSADGVYHTNQKSPDIQVVFNKLVSISQSEIRTVGSAVGTSNFQISDFAVSFKPVQELTDGEYEFTFNAQDETGVFMDAPRTIKFNIDSVGPDVAIKIDGDPTPGYTTPKTTIPIEIEFSDPAAIDEIVIVSKNSTKFGEQEFETNMTDAFKSTDDKVYKATLAIQKGEREGENRLLLLAKDESGNLVEIDHPFNINTLPPKISLVKPSYGVSAEKTFDLVLKTPLAATCRYWLSTADPAIPAPKQFDSLEAMDETGFLSHIKSGLSVPEELKDYPLTVKCKDQFDKESTETYQLSVDPYDPVIKSASFHPNPVVQKPFSASIKVQTERNSFCKFSTVLADFDRMPGKFPGFGMEGTNTHEAVVNFTDAKEYNYFIACKSLAEKGPAEKELSILVGVDVPLTITSYTPAFFTTKDIRLAAETNIDSNCYSSDVPGQQGDSMGDGTPRTIHVKSETVETGNHTYTIACASGGETVDRGAELTSIDVAFLVDDTKPLMDFVDDTTSHSDPEISIYSDRLRAKWSGNDPESGISRYYIAIKDEQGNIVVDKAARRQHDELTDFVFNIENNTKYIFSVTAMNRVSLLSDPMESDGVTADPSAAPDHCFNGEIDDLELDTDCGGPCDLCQEGKKCDNNLDCKSGYCQEAICTAPACDDGVHNGLESDVDCGGECSPCVDNSVCVDDPDCDSGYCSPLTNLCTRTPICANGLLDGSESGVDCGGACPDTCGAKSSCQEDLDCEVGYLCYEDPFSSIKKCMTEEEIAELQQQASPDVEDKDGDGIPDWWEEKYGVDDPTGDPDGDGLTNLEEYQYYKAYKKNISPVSADTDGDGWSDKDEIDMNFDPTNPDSHPTSKLWFFLIAIIVLLALLVGGYFGYRYYQQVIEQKSAPPKVKKPRVKKEQAAPRISSQEISQRADRIKSMFAKKQAAPEEYLSVEDMQREKEQEERSAEERGAKTFSDLGAIGKKQRPKVHHLERESALSNLKKYKGTTARIAAEKRKPSPAAFQKLKGIKGGSLPKIGEKEQILSSLQSMAISSLPEEEKQEIAEKLRLLRLGKLSEEEKKKLFARLKITSSFYEKNKNRLQREYLDWFGRRTKFERVKKSKKK